MARYGQAESDSVQIRIWRNKSDTDGDRCKMEVTWNIRRPRTQALVLIRQDILPSTARCQPSLLWHISTNKKTDQYSARTGYRKLTVYGLESEDLENYTIVSSAQIQHHFTSGASQFDVILKEHDIQQSILYSDNLNQVPFSLTMDNSRSHLLISTQRGTEPSQCLVLCQQMNPFEERIFLKGSLLSALRRKNLESLLPSRRHLELKVLALRKESDSRFSTELLQINGSSTTLATRTYLNKDDLQQLMNKALAFRRARGFQKVLLTHFFRNRWTAYFDDICDNKGGLMEKYRKDANGDQDSAINNGNLFGLFFSPALDSRTLRPPTASYFGELRLSVASYILFHVDSRLYFADFYCHYQAHYITLVLTNRGSEADQFCEKRLIELDPQDNPFLTRKPATQINSVYNRPATSSLFDIYLYRRETSHGFQTRPLSGYSTRLQLSATSGGEPTRVYTTLCDKLHIEVLYTEDVHILELQRLCGEENVYMTMCGTLGNGRSRPQGIPKNPSCPTCNLPPADSQGLSYLRQGLQNLHL